MQIRIALLTLLALAGCGSRPQTQPSPPAPVQAPKPVAAPLPVPAPLPSNWQDWPATPGDWVYRNDDRGALALFGGPGADAIFLIRCDKSRAKIFLSRGGSFPAGETGTMQVRASTGQKSYTLANSSAQPPYVSAELLPSDPQLDAMAYSRGKFVVTVKGVADLVVPAWPELARVVEECR